MSHPANPLDEIKLNPEDENVFEKIDLSFSPVILWTVKGSSRRSKVYLAFFGVDVPEIALCENLIADFFWLFPVCYLVIKL